ncbi:MAG: transcriptional regulator [Verrucomicrobiales bacterium]|nr:transcriptional regulator [Verrucomicrobiales bacterium]
MAKPVQNLQDHLYTQVAERIAGLVQKGILRPGDRVPSVRKLSLQQKVSIATVLQAYRELENQGLIEARPQSGYYVRARRFPLPPEPEISRPVCKATKVSMGDLVIEVARAAGDPGLVRLGAALPSPELLPMQQLNRAMTSISRRSPSLGTGYDAPPGAAVLRNQIARRVMNQGWTLSPDEIVTTCGAQEALNLCLRAVAKAGDTIALESPTYYGVLQIVESLGMRALEIPTHPRDGVSLEALAIALDQHTIKACIFILNFSNPLGSCMPEASKKQLVEMLAKREIPLIEDDIYGELGFGPSRPLPAKAFDRKGLVMLCDSFSKTLAPGYRVGWTAPGRFQQQVEHLKFLNTIATATLPQHAIADFLANGGYDHHLRKVRRVYAEKVSLMTQAVTKYFPEGTRVTRPAGGSVLWVELAPEMNSLELYRRALAAKISIAPGPIFSAKGKFENFIRLSCGILWSEEVESALLKLGRIIASMAKA